MRQVEAFKAVVEHGTVSLAASALHVSQPSLSKLIANLARQTGLKLFERQKGRLILTDRGRRLYSEVERIFVGLDQLGRAVSELRREEAEVLRVGVVPALSGLLLLKAVQDYARLRPGVRLSILIRESHLLVDRIENGKLDVLIASRTTEIRGLERTSLMTAPVVCILPEGHALTRHDIITPALLAGENIVSLTDESTLPQRMAEALEAAGHQVSSSIEISFVTGVCRLVEAGLGVSLVHPLVAADSGATLAIRPFEPSIVVDFHIYRTAARRTRPYVEDFITVFEQAASELLSGDLPGVAGNGRATL
ncbi:LysR substrate-binding domain-containing protein [Rhizobium puerariae]|uniref:LysR substrate-binding domain-containing protein n=1 Tax=Rhizobium puerariae TaxID=1585791 RepID=A0ABV6AI16_9HYPH